MSATRPQWRRGSGDDTSRPVLITAARQSYEEELAARKKRYFLLMSIRIPALVLAAIAYMIWENGWISLAIVIGSIPIPWIAVISANDRPPLPKGVPRQYARGSLDMRTNAALPSAITGSPAHDSPTGRDAPGVGTPEQH